MTTKNWWYTVLSMVQTRKKVLFLITKSNLGGAQQYVFDLATNLPSNVYDVVIAAGGDGLLIDKLKNEGFKVYSLSSLKRNVSFFNEVRTFFTIIGILRKERPDIFHINSSKAGGIGSLAGRLCRIPRIIFTAHGWAFNEDRSPFQKKIIKLLHWTTVILAHTTITVSDGLRKQLNWPLVQQKMVTVHLGRTVRDIKNPDDARGILEMKVQNTSARLIDYHTDFWLGTIAELHPIKRLDRAIDAVATLVTEFPNLRFVIIHDGELREKLEQQVRRLKLQEHVFFTGVVDDAARFISAFDLFVLPSKSESFGYVLIEAGQAGVAVVATNVGGIPDIITSGENGLLVPPDNTQALTGALRTLLLDEDLRIKLAKAHYEKSKTFTVKKMVKETEAVYLNT